MELLFRNKGAMILLMLNIFLSMAAFGLVVPVMPSFIAMLGLDGTTVGLLTAAFAVTQLIFSPFAGKLSDLLGRKKLIVVGLLILAASEAIFGLSNSVVWLYVSRLLGGIGVAMVMPAVMAFTSDITTEDERAKGMGLVSAAMSTGFIIGPGIGGFLAEYGTRVPFYTAAIAVAFAAILTLLVLPEPQRIKSTPASEPKTTKQSIAQQFISSMKAPYFLALIVLLVLGFALSNFETVFGLFLDVKHNSGPKDIALIMTVGAIAGVIIQIGLLDLLVKKVGEMKVIYLSLVVAGVGILGILFVKSFWLLLVVTIIIFAACDLLRPAAGTFLSKLAGEDQGYVAGLNSAYTSLGTILGSSLAGMLYDVNLVLPYIVAGFTLVGCYVILTLVQARSNSKSKLAEAKS
ncbi:MFS transporter [Paenibacillus endoradicis]|uniref:MFS transporter n=1 Tax=Paenibacillus endoradicis TaxID=2972487 RepID=UPI0021599E06|nr:MFS transporter [Paenibacillus endoradicis]MCR8656535.1 MFS transporter [Paenibacillus endoradicis]